MRFRRMIPKGTAIYHCMSRTVDGQPLFNRPEKEVLRKMIGQVADFSGIEVLTYCLMNNHFHLLVRVSPVETLSDAELLRRFKVLYPKPTDFQPATAADVGRMLAKNDESAEAFRTQMLTRMGNVSQFMKTLKQRFSIWFNQSHDRFGPLWSDRFKSVLVEGKGFALQTVAAYIDLNPVRAGIVNDPKDYRFCGYAEAVAGHARALEGIRSLALGGASAAEAMLSYRQLLFGKGGAPVSGGAGISRADAVRVLEKEDGVLPPWVLLRCRVKYFTEGAIIGSESFVRSFVGKWQQKRQRKYPPVVRRITNDAEGVTCINGCRGRAFS